MTGVRHSIRAMITRRIALAAFLLVPPPAAAQTPPAPAATPRAAPVWQMDWGDHFCTLIRLPTDDVPFILAVRTVPGSLTANIRVMRRGAGDLPAVPDTIVLLPGPVEFPVGGGMQALRSGAQVLSVAPLPDDFWAALERSEALELRLGDQVLQRFGLPSAAAAAGALRQCVSDALREWGIDEAALRALRKLPRSINNLGLRSESYPREAMEDGVSGQLVMRLTIALDGRATDCRVVATSATASLDQTACRVALRHGRFEPALDSAGQPTAATYAVSVLWITPSR